MKPVTTVAPTPTRGLSVLTLLFISSPNETEGETVKNKKIKKNN